MLLPANVLVFKVVKIQVIHPEGGETEYALSTLIASLSPPL